MSTLALPLGSPDATLELAGGKGASLSRLAQAHIPVPSGFVITTIAYEAFVQSNALESRVFEFSRSASADDPAYLEEASRAIRELFEQGAIPGSIEAAVRQAYRDLTSAVRNAPDPPAGVARAADEEHDQPNPDLSLAVRSSATAEDLPNASFAGQQETYLNVRGETALLSAVRRCWSSLWSAQAIAYRARRSIDPTEVRLAVVVQQLVLADAAGVLFTVNPVTGDRNEALINAAWGLGEAVVGGRVTPDTLVVDQATGRVKRADVAEKTIMTVPSAEGTADVPVDSQRRGSPVLSPEQAAELVRLGHEIEVRFGGPQDIEWAIAGGQLFILQSRPVTVRPARVPPATRGHAVPGDDAWPALGEQPAQPFDLWTRANVGEIWPQPVSPLSWSEAPAGINTGIRGSLIGLNAAYLDRIQWAKRFYGRVYFNEGALAHVFSHEYCLPDSSIDAALGSRRSAAGPRDTRSHLLTLLRRLPVLLPIWLRRPGVRRQARRQLEAILPRVNEWVAGFMTRELDESSDRELWTEYTTVWRPRVALVRQPYYVISSYAMTDFAMLRGLVKHRDGCDELAQDLVTGLSGVYVAEIGGELWEMARMLDDLGLAGLVLDNPPEIALAQLRDSDRAHPVLERLDAFLERHGHCCPQAGELLFPRWAETPEQTMEVLAGYLRATERVNPAEVGLRQRRRREEAVNHVEAELNPARRVLFRRVLRLTQDEVRLRDNGRYYLWKIRLPIARIYRALARRWVERGWLDRTEDFFFLTVFDVEAVVQAGDPAAADLDIRGLVSERRKAYEHWLRVDAPEVIGPDGQPVAERPLEEPMGTALVGVSVSRGQARGPARVIQDPREVIRLKPGDILVTRSTDAGWTPVFPLLAGLVLEIGGQLSHGAIVAREYGVPTVVNVPNATRRIRDGQTITVEATAGRVYLDGTVAGDR